MASYDDYLSALPKVTYKGRSSGMQRDAVARLLDGTGVNPEHIGSLSAIHTHVDLPAGNAAVYNHNEGSMSVVADAHHVSESGISSVAGGLRHTIAHETGHRFSHIANPVQFSQYLDHPQGRGILEADAENYADQAVPGFHSGYDVRAANGQVPFDADSYKEMRGMRFGDVGRKLR